VVLAVIAWGQRTEAVRNAKEAERQKREAVKQEATRKKRPAGKCFAGRYSKESGKNAEALGYLAQALRLNPENREASGLTAAMLTQLSWPVPLTGSLRIVAALITRNSVPMVKGW